MIIFQDSIGFRRGKYLLFNRVKYRMIDSLFFVVNFSYARLLRPLTPWVIANLSFQFGFC